MKILRLTGLTAVVLLGLGVLVGGNTAIAAETYKKTPLYENGIEISFIAFSPDGARIAFAAGDRSVIIRETAAGNEIASLALPSAIEDDRTQFVAFSPDGTRLVTASRDKTLRVWDIASGRQLAAMQHPSAVGFARFSPDGTRLATVTGDTTARLWDAASGRLLAVLGHESAVRSVAFGPDGARLVTGCIDGTAHIWDVATGRETATLARHEKTVGDARFSPDGTRVVTASDDGTARIWDVASGREILALNLASPVLVAAISPDGTRVITGAGNEAHVFDAETGQEIAVLKGHEREVTHASFSPDGTRIVTASEDRSVRVWDAGSGSEIATLTGDSYAVDYAAFSPDGERILSVAGAQGIVWAKLAATRLPDSATGLWFADPSTPQQPAPPEFIRAMCVANPIKIGGDGLIILFEGAQAEPPHPVLHLRCASDLTCQIFSGPPAQGAELVGEGTLAVSGSTGTMCLTRRCNPISRCADITWTEEERSSGFADRWKASMNTP